MADPFIRSRINNLPLFQRLPAEQIDSVAEVFEAYQLQPNDIVFQQGYPAQGMYVFVSGLGHLTRTTADGSEQFVAEVRAGQYVGEAALFKSINESMTLRVIEQAIVLYLSRERFNELMTHVPEIRANLNSRFAAASGSTSATAPSAETFRAAFKGQRPGETILVFERRRHWWALVQQTLLPIFLGSALIVAGLLLAGSGISWLLFIIAIVLTGFWVGYLFYEWSDDYIIITDQRLIHEENILFGFRQSSSEIPFGSIQEANFSFPDPIAQFFRYGTLDIKTAGTAGNMRLAFIANPEKIQKLIIENRQNHQKAARDQTRDAIRSEIDRFLQDKEGDQPPAAEAKPAPPPPPPIARPSLLATRFINEKGELVYRKHLSIWAMEVTLPLLLLFSGILLLVLGALSVTIMEGLGVLQFIAGFLLILAGGIGTYWADWDWRKDMYIIGDQTIRLIHRRPLWMQDTTEQILLTQIDNVVSEKSGVLNTLLNKGNVRIFLRGDSNPKIFESVPSPATIQEEISNRRAQVLESARKAETQNQHRTIAEYLDVYHERVSARQNQAVSPQPPAPPVEPPPATPARDGTRPPRIPRVRND